MALIKLFTIYDFDCKTPILIIILMMKIRITSIFTSTLLYLHIYFTISSHLFYYILFYLVFLLKVSGYLEGSLNNSYKSRFNSVKSHKMTEICIDR